MREYEDRLKGFYPTPKTRPDKSGSTYKQIISEFPQPTADRPKQLAVHRQIRTFCLTPPRQLSPKTVPERQRAPHRTSLAETLRFQNDNDGPSYPRAIQYLQCDNTPSALRDKSSSVRSTFRVSQKALELAYSSSGQEDERHNNTRMETARARVQPACVCRTRGLRYDTREVSGDRLAPPRRRDKRLKPTAFQQALYTLCTRSRASFPKLFGSLGGSQQNAAAPGAEG